MQRYTEKCEQYFRIHFENRLNFQGFNLPLIKERVKECIIAFDPSFINKSGKKTYGLGSWWSGCAGRAKRGLEICGFAAVDIPLNTAFHLNAIQTPKSKDFNLLHYYCQIIRENYLYFQELTNYCRVKDETMVSTLFTVILSEVEGSEILRFRRVYPERSRMGFTANDKFT